GTSNPSLADGTAVPKPRATSAGKARQRTNSLARERTPQFTTRRQRIGGAPQSNRSTTQTTRRRRRRVRSPPRSNRRTTNLSQLSNCRANRKAVQSQQRDQKLYRGFWPHPARFAR